MLAPLSSPLSNLHDPHLGCCAAPIRIVGSVAVSLFPIRPCPAPSRAPVVDPLLDRWGLRRTPTSTVRPSSDGETPLASSCYRRRWAAVAFCFDPIAHPAIARPTVRAAAAARPFSRPQVGPCAHDLTLIPSPPPPSSLLAPTKPWLRTPGPRTLARTTRCRLRSPSHSTSPCPLHLPFPDVVAVCGPDDRPAPSSQTSELRCCGPRDPISVSRALPPRPPPAAPAACRETRAMPAA